MINRQHCGLHFSVHTWQSTEHITMIYIYIYHRSINIYNASNAWESRSNYKSWKELLQRIALNTYNQQIKQSLYEWHILTLLMPVFKTVESACNPRHTCGPTNKIQQDTEMLKKLRKINNNPKKYSTCFVFLNVCTFGTFPVLPHEASILDLKRFFQG